MLVSHLQKLSKARKQAYEQFKHFLFPFLRAAQIDINTTITIKLKNKCKKKVKILAAATSQGQPMLSFFFLRPER